MKILLFYTYNQSFLSLFFVQLATELGRKGYEIKIITLKKMPKTFIIQPSLTVEILKKKDKFSDLLTIFKTIKREKPDVVISNFSYVNPAIFSGRLLGVKKNIVWFHTLSQQLNPDKFQVWKKSFFLKRASEIIVNSEYLKDDLKKNYAIPAKRVIPIPFWSSLENQKSSEEVPLDKNVFKIGCPGRIEKVKNQELIVDVLKDINLPYSWKLYFAGDGSERKNVENIVNESRIKKNVSFLGVLESQDMRRFYEEMDFIILPSKFEAFGLVLIEALSMGCPVLVSRKFGAVSYIDDPHFLERYTFDPLDPRDLAIKLRKVMEGDLEKPEYFKQIYTRYFVKEKIVEEVVRVLRS